MNFKLAGTEACCGPVVLFELPISSSILRERFGPSTIHTKTFNYRHGCWIFQDQKTHERVEVGLIKDQSGERIVAAMNEFDPDEIPETAERFLAFVCQLE